MKATQVPINRQVDKKVVVHIYNGILLSHKKEYNLTFATVWMDLHSITLSEIILLENGKYHMISLTCRIWRTKYPWPVWLSWLGIILQNKRLSIPSQSGHMPGLWVWSLVGVHAGGNWSVFLFLILMFSPCLSLLSPFSKINKHDLGWRLKRNVFTLRERRVVLFTIY